MADRSDLIIQYFGYLISDYDYVVSEKKFDPQMMGNAYVVFLSSQIGIEIVIDRDQVLITLGDHKKPKENWFDFTDVLHYFSPTKIAYSDIGELFNEISAKYSSIEDTWKEVVEVQLQKLAFMLREYCEPIIKGNLYMEKELREIEKRRVDEFQKRIGKSTNTSLD